MYTNQHVIDQIVRRVEKAAKENGLELDTTRDAENVVAIGSFRWCDETVSVKVEDAEAKALKLTMLDGNGCIVGEMSTSNLDTYIAAYAIIEHLSLTI